MGYFPYNSTVPGLNNDPGDDQPDMLQNAKSINKLFGQDHVSFNKSNGGTHGIVRFGSNIPAPGIAPGWVSVLYSDTSATLPDNQTWPFWQNTGGSELIVGPSKNQLINGYLMIGAYMIQWGADQTTGAGTNTINFSPAFSVAPYFIKCTPVLSAVNLKAFIYTNTITNTNFKVKGTNGVLNVNFPFEWIAIGLR